MLSLAEILNDRCILLDIEEKKKKLVIAKLVGLVADTGIILDPKRIVKGVLDREKQASTGIGHGVAIPHLLADYIDTTIMAFGRTTNAVPFDAIDGQPVNVFFLILGPSGHPTDHLQLLSRLSRLLTHKEFIAELLQAKNAQEIRQKLANIERV